MREERMRGRDQSRRKEHTYTYTRSLTKTQWNETKQIQKNWKKEKKINDSKCHYIATRINNWFQVGLPSTFRSTSFIRESISLIMGCMCFPDTRLSAFLHTCQPIFLAFLRFFLKVVFKTFTLRVFSSIKFISSSTVTHRYRQPF
mgnify:CR=1 FL=1